MTTPNQRAEMNEQKYRVQNTKCLTCRHRIKTPTKMECGNSSTRFPVENSGTCNKWSPM